MLEHERNPSKENCSGQTHDEKGDRKGAKCIIIRNNGKKKRKKGNRLNCGKPLCVKNKRQIGSGCDVWVRHCYLRMEVRNMLWHDASMNTHCSYEHNSKLRTGPCKVLQRVEEAGETHSLKPTQYWEQTTQPCEN